MEVFDFSMKEYTLYNTDKMRIKRMVLFVLICIIIGAIVFAFHSILNGENLDFAVSLSMIIITFCLILGIIATTTFTTIDYFDVRNTFYVMFESKLYCITIYPRDRFGAYEEIGNLRLFLFLVFGKDILSGAFFDSTGKFGPTKQDVINNFQHFVVNNKYETLSVECLGYVYDYIDNMDSITLRTSTKSLSIKKYYTNLFNITKYTVREGFDSKYVQFDKF